MAKGFSDWVIPINISKQDLPNLNVNIFSQTIEKLKVDIASQSMGNIGVDIKAITVGNIGVDIKAQSVGNLNINVTNPALTVAHAKPALSFDGVDDYVITQTLSRPTSGTIAVWVNPDSSIAPPPSGIYPAIAGYGGDGLIIIQANTGKPYFHIIDSSNNEQDLTSNTPLTAGVFCFIVATWYYDGTNTTLKIYRNGVLDAPPYTFSGPPRTSSYPFYLAQYGRFRGEISEVYAYNRALSDSEVQQIYNNPNSPPTNGLVLWLKLDEGSGNVAKDSSGNGNNGTIYGATWVSQIGSVPASVNVNISAQVINLSIYTGSGLRVNAATGLITKAYTWQNRIAPNISSDIITINGKGRLVRIGIKVYDEGDALATDTEIKVTADGAVVYDITLNQLDYLNGRQLVYALRSGTSSSPVWGTAPQVSQKGGCVVGYGWVDNLNSATGSIEKLRCVQVYAFMLPEVEFNSSCTVTVVTGGVGSYKNIFVGVEYGWYI